jgi:hypothetical protein
MKKPVKVKKDRTDAMQDDRRRAADNQYPSPPDKDDEDVHFTGSATAFTETEDVRYEEESDEDNDDLALDHRG